MDKNPFEILNVEPMPILDLAALRKSYIEIQRSGHPDLGNDAEVSEMANQAYSLLKSDEGRMSQILQFYGTWPPDTKLIGMDFLMEAMELSEAIDDLNASGVSHKTNVENSLKSLSNELENQLSELNKKAENNINWQKDSQLLDEISIWYQRRRYITRLEKNLNGEHEL